MTQVFIGLGSNMGDRVEHLHQALSQLDQVLHLNQLSPVYETAPKYVEDQSPFLNMAVGAEAELEASPLLAELKRIEVEIGRVPSPERYGPRAIDLDILFYGDLVLETPDLTIPHPLMFEREFVLRPLADIAGDFRHPVSGKTVLEMLLSLQGASEAQLIAIDV